MRLQGTPGRPRGTRRVRSTARPCARRPRLSSTPARRPTGAASPSSAPAASWRAWSRGCRAPSRVAPFSPDRPATSYSGWTSAVILSSIHDANDSFSQRSSHQAIVTRSPNHMCAISCAVIVATNLSRAASIDALGVEEQDPIDEGDRPGVLHGAVPILGDRDQVELVVRVLGCRSTARARPGAAGSSRPPFRRAADCPLTVTMRAGIEVPGSARTRTARSRRANRYDGSGRVVLNTIVRLPSFSTACRLRGVRDRGVCRPEPSASCDRGS